MATPLRSKIFLVVFGLIIAAMGGAFIALMWNGYQKVRTTYTWTEHPCLILESRIIEDSRVPNALPEYRIDVRYTYEIDGTRYTGDQVRTRVRRLKEKEKLTGFAESIPAGTQTVCYVDPTDPTNAILQRDTKAALYTIWFPGLFLVGGLGIAASALIKK
ncbi:DUF3592 domain-containing protein [Sulfuriroseicoccus oceanibius]|uniref:DUF3592 domain-containing protein n=1 Tax=Sulfuriroseicoccus oceanibius TaxID=2707525 RepID=A0A6B3L5E4_9BACT|nr:DUF3592 domain-containing protein [Sulfuriroseicoccus oceanibius]QQL45099.1 DUF3592 domain-containing protein [Sulfuriroseicoccus oceanibius]